MKRSRGYIGIARTLAAVGLVSMSPVAAQLFEEPAEAPERIASPTTVTTGMVVDQNGNVGVGTETPTSPVQIERSGTASSVPVLYGRDSGGTSSARIMLRLDNNGRVNFNLFDTLANTNWQFSNTAIGFQINETTSPGVEFRVTGAGDLFLEGQVNASSSVEKKENFAPVDHAAVLEAVAGLPILSWNYRGQAAPHIGPMAEDFYSTFKVGVGETYLSPSDVGGVALAAIQGLRELVTEKDAEIEELENRLARVESLLEQVTAAGHGAATDR